MIYELYRQNHRGHYVLLVKSASFMGAPHKGRKIGLGSTTITRIQDIEVDYQSENIYNCMFLGEAGYKYLYRVKDTQAL